jgi:hypothetical protein
VVRTHDYWISAKHVTTVPLSGTAGVTQHHYPIAYMKYRVEILFLLPAAYHFPLLRTFAPDCIYERCMLVHPVMGICRGLCIACFPCNNFMRKKVTSSRKAREADIHWCCARPIRLSWLITGCRSCGTATPRRVMWYVETLLAYIQDYAISLFSALYTF